MNRTPSTWKWLVVGWTAGIALVAAVVVTGCRQDKQAVRDEPSRQTRVPDEPPSHEAPAREPMH